MRTRCRSCGARWTDGEPCDARFDRALSLEFTDAAYAAVHHLTVTAYLLQHDRYSHDGWLAARALLRAMVEDGLRPEEVRRVQRRPRASVTRGDQFRDFGLVRWSRTIADVRMADATGYRDDVRRWAGAVLDDTREVTRGHTDS